MNENTAKLLEQLAQKMGTTSEYLWGVLLRQAPISATVNLVQIVLIILFGFGLFKIHNKYVNKAKIDGRNDYDRDASLAVIMILSALVFLCLIIAALFSLENVVDGYFNPEWWALKRILNVLR